MTDPSLDTKNRALGITAGLMAAIIWGGFPVVTRLGVSGGEVLDKLDITALRFGVSGLFLLPFLLKRGLFSANWKAILLMTCGAGAPYMLVSSIALGYAPAGHFGVITPSTMLACSSLAGWLILGDKPDKIRFAGLLIILLGVFCIGERSFISASKEMLIGDLCCVLGGILWATYTIAAKVWKVDPFHSTAIVAVFSMIAFLPFYFMTNGYDALLEAPDETILQAIYQGILSAFLALFLYSVAVSRLGAAQGAIFAALVPGVAILLAIPVLHEIPNALELFGVLIVSLGMVLSLGLHKIFIRILAKSTV